MLHLSEFVCTLRSSVLVVFNNFLLWDATVRSKISSDQKRFFIALSLYPLSFFVNTPFKYLWKSILVLPYSQLCPRHLYLVNNVEEIFFLKYRMLKGTVVNRVYHSVNGGSFKITPTVPLIKLDYFDKTKMDFHKYLRDVLWNKYLPQT